MAYVLVRVLPMSLSLKGPKGEQLKKEPKAVGVLMISTQTFYRKKEKMLSFNSFEGEKRWNFLHINRFPVFFGGQAILDPRMK